MPPQPTSANCLGVFVTVLGGLHYGYSIAIVGACAAELKALHGGSSWELSLASSCALLGAFIGSPLSACVSERFGRRIGTICGEMFIIVGSAMCAFAPSWTVIWVGRTVVGVGIGFCTLAKPLYVKETAAPSAVGSVLAAFAPAVALGVLLARSMEFLSSVGWDGKAALGAAPAVVLLLVACMHMPESPAWQQRRGASMAPAAATANPPCARAHPRRALRACAGREGRRLKEAAMLACTLGVANQGTGSYAFNVYGSVLLPLTPVGDAVSAAANVLGAVVVVPLMGCCPSRWLYLGGLGGMLVCCGSTAALLAWASDGELVHRLVTSACTLWSLFYQLGPGGGYFCQIVQVSTEELRPFTIALGNTVRFGCEFLSSLLLIGVAEAVGLAPILAGYALLSCACMLIFALKLPEVGARFKQSASAQAHVDAEQGGARRAPLLPEERPSTAYGSATSINVGDVPPSGNISTASALWPLKRDEHCQWR